MSGTRHNRPTGQAQPRRRRWTPAALATGVLGAVVLGLTMNTSLAGFVASITNTVNTAGAGTAIMQEQNADGTVTCLSTDGTGNNVTGNAATCTTINKYGGNTAMAPGQTVNTTVTIKNVGTEPATTFTLTPGVCSQSGNVTGSATDLCARLGVVLTQTVAGTTTTITPAGTTLATLAAGGVLTLASPVNPGTTVTYTFAVTLASSAGNTYQGLKASQPLTWTFSSGATTTPTTAAPTTTTTSQPTGPTTIAPPTSQPTAPTATAPPTSQPTDPTATQTTLAGALHL